jgi:acyl dehydratase
MAEPAPPLFKLHDTSDMKSFQHLTDLQPLVGQEIAVSDWLTVDQARIDKFADATGDHQWIHVDPERAAKGPFATTVAHGFLTHSLLPELSQSAFGVADTRMGVKYGLNRERFPAPVPAGSRIRGRFKLLAYEPIDGGAQVTVEVTMEREGQAKPVCVAESVGRRYV